jgi:hypothetical protein
MGLFLSAEVGDPGCNGNLPDALGRRTIPLTEDPSASRAGRTKKGILRV